MEKIKILQIVPSLSLSNGVSAYLLSYYENINFDRFDTTILVLNERDKGRYDSFKRLGCNVIDFFKDCSIFEYLKRVENFFKKNSFDIVHCHVANYGAIYMHYAKKYGVKSRILHSHANKYADNFLHAIRNRLLVPIAVKESNYYIACSDDAGKFLFKNKPFIVLNNAIDCDRFRFNTENRSKIRKELGIEDKFVIGEFGRFCPQKNQLFTLKVFKEILDFNDKAMLVLIGNGGMKDKVTLEAKNNGILDKVIILDSKPNISDYYSALDVFLLPSTYEGLGIVLVEAQVNSLPCYTSLKRVPNLAKICPLLEFIDLNNTPKQWADKIISNKNDRADYFNQISKSNFNIKNEAKKLEEFYDSIVK